MKLTIRHTTKFRDAWIFLLSFLLIFPIGCGFISINVNTKVSPTSKVLQNNFSNEQFQEINAPEIIQELRSKFLQIPSTVEVSKPVKNFLGGTESWNLYIKLKGWSSLDQKFSKFTNHLVIQIDDRQPLRINTNEKDGNYLKIEIPKLSSQYHTITIFTSLPWGEAIKSLGSYENINLNEEKNIIGKQKITNPLLVLASPSHLSKKEPILIDWLVFNVPLKHLSKNDAQWHLRISINDTSFLIDRSIPLWIQGFHEGLNTLSVDLVDKTGEPISTNSVIRQIVIDSLSKTLKNNINDNPLNEELKRIELIDLRLLEPTQGINIETKKSTILNEIKVFQKDESEKILFSKYNFGNSLNKNINTMKQESKTTPDNIIRITLLELT